MKVVNRVLVALVTALMGLFVALPGTAHAGMDNQMSLVDGGGRELEMPSAYDEFSRRARADYSGGSAQARTNRDRLIDAMQRRGFRVLKTEWWHFDDPDWRRYPVMDLPLADIRGTRSR